VTIIVGDNLVTMRGMADASVDAIVTDPPAGIAFMSKSWDTDKGGRDAWIAWLAEVMAEAFRVAKPGAHAVVWALPRTSGWTHRAIEDAGWTVRDCLTHLFATGFPKSHNLPGGLGTALKPAAEFWYLARKPLIGTVAANVMAHGTGGLNIDGCRIGTDWSTDPTRRGWQGGNSKSVGVCGNFGNTGDRVAEPSPAGRWPANVLLSHAPDCVEVGARRVKAHWGQPTRGDKSQTLYRGGFVNGGDGRPVGYADADGMETVTAWECAPGCAVAALDAQSGERGGHSVGSLGKTYERDGKGFGSISESRKPHDYGDTGGASRFFLNVAPIDAEDWDGVRFKYQAKASRAERNAGLDGMPERAAKDDHNLLASTFRTDPRSPNGGYENKPAPPQSNGHPTVKPLSLMAWLVRLVTPPNGLVLDPFTGSGSTGVACVREGFRFVGIEQDADYAAIAEARIAHAEAVRDCSAPVVTATVDDLPMFATAAD